MLLDLQNLMSDKQALTSTGTKTQSTNILDLGVAGTMPAHYGATRHIIGSGNPVPFVVMVSTTFTTADAGSLRVYVESDTATNFSTNLITHFDSGVIAVATLVAGYKFGFPLYLPPKVQRYLRVAYTIANNFTAGTITAGLLLDTIGDSNALTVAQM